MAVVLALQRLRPWAALASIVLAGLGVVGASAVAFRLGYWIGPLQPLLAVAAFGLLGFVSRTHALRQMLDRFAGSAAAGELATRGAIQTRTTTATILFADVRGYTQLGERLPPEELIEVLNQHYRWIDGIVTRCGGRVDKHIGDAVMAVFEEGRRRGGHAAAAVEAGVDLVRTAAARSGPAAELTFGIGIHTGEVTTGALGESKQEYASVGDTVNVAARLEQATRLLEVPLLVSEQTLRSAGLVDRFARLDSLTLKGRAEPVVVYTLEAGSLP